MTTLSSSSSTPSSSTSSYSASPSRNYWLLKAEPESHVLKNVEVGLWPFSLVLKKKIVPYFGVRNFQARNFLRDQIKKGDYVFYYHSSTKKEPPGIAGVCEVEQAAFPDPDALDPASPFYDEKHTVSNPRWYQIMLKALYPLPAYVTLSTLKEDKFLQDSNLTLLRQSRLSVQPVTELQWNYILNNLANQASTSTGNSSGGSSSGSTTTGSSKKSSPPTRTVTVTETPSSGTTTLSSSSATAKGKKRKQNSESNPEVTKTTKSSKKGKKTKE